MKYIILFKELAIKDLFRQNLSILTYQNMLAINFGLIFKSRWLIGLNLYLLIYDFVSILLARIKMESATVFLQMRNISIFKRLKVFIKELSFYLIPAIMVHLSLFNDQNMINSSQILICSIICWLLLSSLMLDKVTTFIRQNIILLILVIFRSMI